jgi:hypothetical protein
MVHYRFQINCSFHYWQAKAIGGTHQVGYSGAFYQRFARDTPCPGTVTADTVFFYKSNSRTELYCKWGSNQTSSTTTDDSQIIHILHLSPPSSIMLRI